MKQMEENQYEFLQMLETFIGADNNARSIAERKYEALKERHDSPLPFLLLSVMGDSNISSHIRKLAAVLLRRITLTDEDYIYDKLDNERKHKFRIDLLNTLENENDPFLKSRICDIVGELARHVLENEEWPEVIPYLQRCIQSTSSLHRESGLALLGMLAEYITARFTTEAEYSTVISICNNCLMDESNQARVMISAIRALHSIISNMSQISDIDRFQALVPTILKSFEVLLHGIRNNLWGEGAPLSYLESLIEIAEDSATVHLYESHLNIIFETMYYYMSQDASQGQLYVPSPIKHMILEYFVSLCATTKKKIRKMKGPNGQKGYFVDKLFPLCVNMMCLVEEDKSWSSSEELEEYTESATDSDVAEVALDRMCKDLGLNATWFVCSAQFNELLSCSVWQALHTGLRYLGNYMEVSAKITDKKQLKEHIRNIGTTIVSFSRHPHSRVRAACFYCLNQFFTMHKSNIKPDQVSSIISLILESLPITVNPPPRVRRNILLCLTCVIDSSPANFVEQTTYKILCAVTNALEAGPVIVQELCVSVIMSLIETVPGNQLMQHYDGIMPVLKTLLARSQLLGLEGLWGQCMMCCAMLGEASGKDKFRSDALGMMNSLAAVQDVLSEGSEAKMYLVKAWVRIARCLREDFVPYLPALLNKLLAAVTQDITVGNIDPEELETRSDVYVIEGEEGWTVVRTAAVEEQAIACQQIMLVIEKLQEHFFPFIEQTVQALGALLNSPHEDVRSFCVAALPEIVRSAAKATAPDRTALLELSEFIIGKLLNFIETEDVLELIMTGLQSLKQIFIYTCTNWESRWPYTTAEPPVPTPEISIPFLNVAQMEALTQCATIVMRDSLQRRAVLRAEAQVSGGLDDDDMADETLFQMESMELHFNIAELLGIILKTHGEMFLPVYNQIWHETVTTMAHPNCLKEDKQFSYLVISDVVEFGLSHASATDYFASSVPLLIDGVQMADPGIRQACGYAIGIAAEKYPVEFRPYAMLALNALSVSVRIGEDPEEARGSSTDNAVGAVGIILEKMETEGGFVSQPNDALLQNAPFIWLQWLSYLPLRHDLEEGNKSLCQLCRLVRSNHQSLLSGSGRIEQILSILVEVLDSTLVGPATTKEIVLTLQLMRVNGSVLFGVGGMERVVSQTLSQEGQQKIINFLNMDLSSPGMSSSPSAPVPIHDVLMR